MKFTLYKNIGLAILLVTCIACNKETKSEPEAELAPGAVPPTQNPAFMNLDGQASTATPTSTPTSTPAGQAAAAPVTTAPGMNPPHGQPGHRCEIAVGAPLNSQPVKPSPGAQTQPTAAPTSFSPPAARQQPATAAPVATAPGMNPPHGQPGHRCEVAVGAPLPK
jgi:hypothetical protein